MRSTRADTAPGRRSIRFGNRCSVMTSADGVERQISAVVTAHEYSAVDLISAAGRRAAGCPRAQDQGALAIVVRAGRGACRAAAQRPANLPGARSGARLVR